MYCAGVEVDCGTRESVVKRSEQIFSLVDENISGVVFADMTMPSSYQQVIVWEEQATFRFGERQSV